MTETRDAQARNHRDSEHSSGNSKFPIAQTVEHKERSK